jgi:VWFA-related protein
MTIPSLLALALSVAPAPETSPLEPVVVDLVVRDKKDAPVLDLRPEELELLEDGTKQAITSLHRVALDPAGGVGSPHDVVLLFPRLQGADRDRAQAAAEELIRKQLAPGMRVAVLNAGSELAPVQDYSADPALLRDAVKRALAPGARSGAPSAESLLSLVRSLKDQPGRKAAVIFSAGVEVPPGSEHLVAALAGLANRFRISFYAVDPRGLEMSKRPMDVAGGTGEEEISGWMHGHLEETVGNVQARTDPRWQDPRSGSGVGGPPAALEAIARLTGGFVVPRTNAFSKAMHQIAEDLGTYYEITYTPSTAKPDGSFRKVEVKVAREGARVQTGQDYLVGASGATPTPEFEKPLLAALDGAALPHELPAWDRAFHFAWDGKTLEHALWLTVPLAQVMLSEDAEARRFNGEVALLARVKDASGQVLSSFSQDFPLVGPLDQLPRARAQSITFVRRLRLEPGDYTLETAARDVTAGKGTARRTPFKVVAPKGLVLSSVSLGDLRPVGASADPSDPFRVESQTLTANVGQPIKAGVAPMTLHCVVYPQLGSKAPASATFTLLSGESALINQTAPLPAADATGRVSYGSTLRTDLIPPGTYQMKVSVSQGSERAEESASFTIAP